MKEDRMRKLAGVLVMTAAWAQGQVEPGPEFRHLYTFGSKEGIHPRTLLNGRPATAAAGRPANPYGLVFPVAVATDAHGRVWISDSGTASAHVFDQASGAYREIRKIGEHPLRQPSGVAADREGRIFLADAAAGALYLFDERGDDHTLVKPGAGTLEGPTAIALSADGKTIYVADPPKGVVAELNREGEVNGSIRVPPELGEPIGITVADNQVWVLGSREQRVGVFNPGGRQIGEFRWDGIRAPMAFTYDATRRRFLVANPRWMTIEIFTEEGRNLGNFGRAGEGVDEMRRVDALHVDPQGRLYVVDSRHGKVLVFGESTRGL
jgi:DNA-binding beta-propeller fold protein YncE